MCLACLMRQRSFRWPAWRCAGRVHIALARSEALQLPLVFPVSTAQFTSAFVFYVEVESRSQNRTRYHSNKSGSEGSVKLIAVENDRFSAHYYESLLER